jgi:hypothetical protein
MVANRFIENKAEAEIISVFFKLSFENLFYL